MSITEVKIHHVSDDKVRAYVSVVFDHCFIVRDLKVIDGDERLFVAMPSKRMKSGFFRDTAHPLNAETRLMVEREVLRAYNRAISSPVR